MLVRDNSEDLRWQLGSSHGSCYLIVTHKETVARRTLFVKGAWAGRRTNQDAQQSRAGEAYVGEWLGVNKSAR